MPERTIKERTPSEVVTAPKKDRESALRLARMLVAQGRYEGALGVYAELDRRGGMDAKTLLEYAGIASLIEPPRATLTLFTRTKALAEAEKVQFSPAEEAGLLTGLGRAYMASARMSDARSALERAVELDDKNVSALNAYGIVLDAAGEHEEAVKYFDKALAQSPTNVQVLNNLALAKLGMNDAKGALKVLGDAENFSSSDASGVLTPKMNLAFVQFMTGSADRSRETLQSFMTNEQAEEALKKLGSQGESNYAFEGLDPNTDYLAFAAGLDAAGEVNTKIESKTFKTKELAAGATFEVKFTCYYNGADFTITPSDLEFPYYSAIRPAFRYQGLDDDALLQTIIAEDSFMLDFMAAPGVYEYKNEGVYLPIPNIGC